MTAKKAILLCMAQFLLLALAPLISNAGPDRVELQKCLDRVNLSAFKNSQWARCFEVELQRQDQNLNINYQKVLRGATAETKEALLKGQRSWLAYRDAWCAYEEVYPVAPGGTVNRLMCLVEITSLQNDKLKSSIRD